MDVRSAELTKYAANAMLATKISFMNELANIAERVGADIEKVRVGIGSDPRIGYHFIYPGAGYGGSCFPKDVQALVRSARARAATSRSCSRPSRRSTSRRRGSWSARSASTSAVSCKGRTIALWGLAFKPNTDDMREAPLADLIEELLAAGAQVRAFDPVAMGEARRIFGERAGLTLVPTMPRRRWTAPMRWPSSPSGRNSAARTSTSIKCQLKQPVIFDGRNLYDPRW